MELMVINEYFEKVIVVWMKVEMDLVVVSEEVEEVSVLRVVLENV